jgi:hypothetical protein
MGAKAVVFKVVLVWLALVWGGMAAAQTSWIQIEAQPTQPAAELRAEHWAASFGTIAGFRLASGWFAIAIGPYDAETAAAELRTQRARGAIPDDSYVVSQVRFGPQFWPSAAPGASSAAEPRSATVATASLDPSPASESSLTASQRQAAQSALRWFGYYTAQIDGAFGMGTRRAIAQWQARIGEDPTGYLSAAQHAALLQSAEAEQADLQLETLLHAEAGISLTLPMGLLEPARIEPPFVLFDPKSGTRARVVLISQPGDYLALLSLQENLQARALLPPQGAQSKSRSGFRHEGQIGQALVYAQAQLTGGLIKGFVLVWPADDDGRMQRLVQLMRASFAPLGERALPAAPEPITASSSQAARAEPAVTSAPRMRSGFYVSEQGDVLTGIDAVAGCSRVQVDGAEADIAFADPIAGLAILAPRLPVSPRAIASFRADLPAPGAEVAVAGYPYGAALSSAVLTFGALAGHTGLAGDPNTATLALVARVGDAGGPVLDAAGAVLGLLLPHPDPATRQRFPSDMALLLQAQTLTPLLAQRGLSPSIAADSGALAVEDLSRLGRALTVQVSCWNP